MLKCLQLARPQSGLLFQESGCLRSSYREAFRLLSKSTSESIVQTRHDSYEQGLELVKGAARDHPRWAQIT